MSRRAGLAALLLCVVAASGCAHYPLNAQLAAPSGKGGYRFPQMVADRPDPADELFVCLSFSGGGTRAAAFSHGALLRLRDIDIGRGGAPRSLLDEVIASRASREGHSPPPTTGCSGRPASTRSTTASSSATSRPSWHCAWRIR